MVISGLWSYPQPFCLRGIAKWFIVLSKWIEVDSSVDNFCNIYDDRRIQAQYLRQKKNRRSGQIPQGNRRESGYRQRARKMLIRLSCRRVGKGGREIKPASNRVGRQQKFRPHFSFWSR